MTQYNDRHQLGLPEMDEQHRYLYSLFDRIEKTPAVKNYSAFRLLLAEIERYIQFHFTSEENLMRAYGFSGFAVHQSDHETAANRFVRFSDDFDSHQLNPNQLRIFLTGWLMEHSQQSDNLYAEWIASVRSQIMTANPTTE